MLNGVHLNQVGIVLHNDGVFVELAAHVRFGAAAVVVDLELVLQPANVGLHVHTVGLAVLPLGEYDTLRGWVIRGWITT